jgi:ParB family chromosome partitioning protein
MNAKNRGLGRGLSALISSREEEHASSGGTLYVNVEEITPSPYQPRKNFNQEKLEELAASIQANGLIQPLVVRSTESGYELITGERRWRASKKAGLARVPAIVRDMDNNTAMALAMIENLQREDLNPMEKAVGMERLRTEAKLGQEEIARELGISRAQVANTLRLLKLPETIHDMLAENKISSGHARTLLALPSPEDMLQAAQKIIKNGLNVRQTEKLIQDWGKKKKASSKPLTDKNLKETVKTKIVSALGSDVRIGFHGNSDAGKITLEYKNEQDLKRILDTLEKEN